MRHTRSLPFAALAASTFVALGATPASGAAQERHVLTGESAVIWNLAGEMRLVAGSGRDVVVEVTRGGSDGGRLDVTASGGQLKVRYPDTEVVYRGGADDRWRGSTTLRVRDDGTFDGDWDGGGRRVRVRTSGSGLEAHADLRIHVPAGKRMEVHLALGAVFVENVDGDLRIDVHSASIRATGTKGRLVADAGSGSVRVENGAGELDIDTGSGSTTVNGFSGRSVSIDAGSGSIEMREITAERLAVDVGSGSVRAESLSSGDVSIDTGSGGVELWLTKVPGRTEIDTGSGSVRLELPVETNADVDIETGSGGISSDFAVTMDQLRRNELRGRIGQGGNRIHVNTGSGGVRLIRR